MNQSIIDEDLLKIISSDLPWRLLEGKSILISGANGFLPAYMVETLLFLNKNLLNNKIKVIGLVRNKEKGLARFSRYLKRNDFRMIIQDVCDPVSITDKNLDYIIHAASQASPKYFGKDPVGTINANVLGTHNLLSLAREKNIKCFLFFSSGEVYGKVANELVSINETDFGYLDPMDLRSCYGESKRLGETMCISWQHQYGIPVKIVRPTHTYGPGMSLVDGRVFADFVSKIVFGKDIELNSDGTATRPFCYLADAVIGYFTVLFKGENGNAYNIGSNKETSILELAETLINLFPEKKLKVIKNQLINPKGYIKSNNIKGHYPDINKIMKLGWFPSTSIEDGFYRTIKYYE